jgi:MFS family permease
MWTQQPHFGPIAGGFVSLNLGWRWIFKLNAIMLSVVLVLFIFTFPETLYSREEFSNLEERSYWSRIAFRGKVLNCKVSLKDFMYNFKMMKYWAMIVPCIYYAT